MGIQARKRNMMDVINEAVERIERGEIAPMTDEEIEADIQEYRREKAEKNRKKGCE